MELKNVKKIFERSTYNLILNNKRKTRKNKLLENIIKNNIFILIIIIRFLLFKILFIKAKNNKNILNHNKDSKISLKIKGIGESAILGNEGDLNFSGINYLKEVYINENKQETIDNRYYFNQTDNYVELIWDNNINNCDNMFINCTNIIEINLSNFDTSLVTSMHRMFYNCSKLSSLYLSNLNTSLVTSMSYMFYYCKKLISLDFSYFDTSNTNNISYMFCHSSKLKSLDISNFNTSKVKTMACIFYYCSSLTTLNLSKINTSQVTNMDGIFSFCKNLIILDLSNFNTSQVTKIRKMFSNCYSLISLNLKSFNTSKVKYMNGMFSNCSSLISLNLSNINTSQVTNMSDIFYNCSSLSSLDISNFDASLVNNMASMFYNCSSLISLNLSNFNTSLVTDMSIMFAGCSSLISLDINFDTSLVINMSDMFYNCSLLTSLNVSYFNTSKVTDMGSMFSNCFSLTSLNLSNFNTSQVENMNNMFYNCSSLTSLNLSNFIISKVKYIFLMFDSCINLEYINLNNFDEKQLALYDDMFLGVRENIVICIEENNTKYKIFPQILKKHCYIIDCSDNWKLKQKNIGNCYKKSKDEEIKYYDNILQNIENKFTSDDYDTSNIDGGQDEIITNGKITTTLTTSENQKNNINNNMTKIDLGECENLLRKFFNLSFNESLYIKKIDIIQEGIKTLKVEYNVYAKLFEKNLINLNLTICEKSKISISIPIILNEDIDKFNSSSGYYNDICYTTTSEDGTDILIKDRQTEFCDKNKIICQENCDFTEYNYNTLVAKCSCEVKECSNSFADMNINKAKILDNFKNIKNFINFNFLICYKKLPFLTDLVSMIFIYSVQLLIFTLIKLIPKSK